MVCTERRWSESTSVFVVNNKIMFLYPTSLNWENYYHGFNLKASLLYGMHFSRVWVVFTKFKKILLNIFLLSNHCNEDLWRTFQFLWLFIWDVLLLLLCSKREQENFMIYILIDKRIPWWWKVNVPCRIIIIQNPEPELIGNYGAVCICCPLFLPITILFTF